MSTITELARHERYQWCHDAWACRCGDVLTDRGNEDHDTIVQLWAEHVAAALGLAEEPSDEVPEDQLDIFDALAT